MAAPTVLARQASVSSTSDSTSFTPTLATATLGKLLLAVISADGSPTLSTSSTGWRKMGQASNGANVTQSVFIKDKATGSDALVISSTASEQYSAEVFCIDAGNIPGLSIEFANGNSTNSNPPSVTISPTQDVLWIATRSGDAQVVATVAPSGYGNLTSQAGGGANGASTNTAELSVNADVTEDPGTFTSATEQWVSATIAVWSDTISRWHQFNKPTAWTLSNSSLTATQSAAPGNGTTMLTSLPHNSGKWYFTLRPTTIGGGAICIAPAGSNINDYPEVSGAVVYVDDGSIIISTGLLTTIQGFSAGDIIGGAIDFGTGDVWFKNVTTGSNYNNSGAANPSTGVGGINIPTLAGVFAMPGAAGSGGVTGMVVVWDGSPASGAPSGFPNWDAAAGTSVALSGVAATGSQGTLGVSRSKALTGVSATGAVGTLTPVSAYSVALTGVSATGSLGALGSARSKALTGVAASGQVGSLVAVFSRALTGTEATGALGTLTPSTAYSAALSGVSATGALGALRVARSHTLTGVEATGEIGTLTPFSGFAVTLTGISATGSVGTLRARLTKPLAGVSATGTVGTLTPFSGFSVALVGISATGAIGTLGVSRRNAMTGVAATGTLGTVTPHGAYAAALTGVQATGSLGSIRPLVAIPLTGVSATAALGILSPTGGIIVISPEWMIAPRPRVRMVSVPARIRMITPRPRGRIITLIAS